MANTYNGATLISAGTLSANNATALGSVAGSGVTVSSATTLDINNVSLGAYAIALNGGSITSNTASGSLSGAITLGANSTFTTASGLTLTLTGLISDGGSQYTLTKSGTGTVILNGTYSYGGGANNIAINAGTLTLSQPSALGTTNGTTTGLATVASGAVLNTSGTLSGSVTNPLSLNGTGIAAGGALVNSGTNTFSGNIALAGNASISNGNSSLTLSGVISGANALTSIGSGTLTLSGNNTYSGGTTVSAGTLAASTSSTAFGTGTVAVSNNAAASLTNSLSGTMLNNFTLVGTGISSAGALVDAGTNTISGTIGIGTANVNFGVTGGSDSLTLSGIISGTTTTTVTALTRSVTVHSTCRVPTPSAD